MASNTSVSPRRGKGRDAGSGTAAATAAGRFDSTLRASLAARRSADDIYRGLRPEKLRRLVPPVRQVRQLARDIYETRLPRLLADVVDHVRRGVYTFAREEGDAARYPDQLALTPEERRCMQEHRRSGGTRVSPDEPDGDVIELTVGQCVARLAEDCAARRLSDRSMEWLFDRLDYNLDWLCFGVGGMYRDLYTEVDTPWTDERRITCEEDRYPSFAELNKLRHATPWTLMEWNWLINNVARSNYRSRQPIQSMCVRMVASWNIDPCQPQLPDPPAFVRWMRRWLVREFMMGSPAESDWKQAVIEECCVTRDKIYLLFGITKVAASAYRRGITSPSAGIMRVCYFLNMIIRRRGREGFLRFLDMVDDEARGRRFAGLWDVFLQGTWVYHDKDFHTRRGRPRKAAAASGANSGDDPDDYLEVLDFDPDELECAGEENGGDGVER